RSHTTSERDEQRVLRLRMQSQRQIREQPHVTLVARIRGRHRKSVGHQSVIIRLLKQIAPQELPGSGFTFDFFDKMLSFRFVQLSRVREMQCVAMTRKKHDDEYEHAKQCDRSETI